VIVVCAVIVGAGVGRGWQVGGDYEWDGQVVGGRAGDGGGLWHCCVGFGGFPAAGGDEVGG
jgi:hypothetical protein